MKKLNIAENQVRLASLPKEWVIVAGATLDATFSFESFDKSIEFINRVATVSNKHNHHPTIKNTYDKVELSITTHSVGGLTTKDFELAKAISEIKTD